MRIRKYYNNAESGSEWVQGIFVQVIHAVDHVYVWWNDGRRRPVTLPLAPALPCHPRRRRPRRAILSRGNLRPAVRLSTEGNHQTSVSHEGTESPGASYEAIGTYRRP